MDRSGPALDQSDFGGCAAILNQAAEIGTRSAFTDTDAGGSSCSGVGDDARTVEHIERSGSGSSTAEIDTVKIESSPLAQIHVNGIGTERAASAHAHCAFVDIHKSGRGIGIGCAEDQGARAELGPAAGRRCEDGRIEVQSIARGIGAKDEIARAS